MSRIFEGIRWAIYGLTLYNTYSISWWIAIGFVLAFIHIELCILAISVLRNQVTKIQAELEEERDSDFQHPSMDFGFEFSSTPLSKEEELYIEEAQEGSVESVEKFLASRCQDKSVDFTTIPLPVKLIMTAKVMALVESKTNNKSATDWDDVIEDTSDNN